MSASIRVRLGRSGLDISRLGVGAWRLAGGDHLRPRPEGQADRAVATIRRALELGLNWIDTSNAYGLGTSELYVAQALRGLSERPYVITKCGWTWDDEGNLGQSLRAGSVRSGFEDSLRRLELDEVDICLIHWPVPDEEIEEGWSTLAELQKEGKARHIGVSNFSVAQLQRCEPIAPVEVAQPPFSLADDEAAREILPYCQEHDIGVIVYSPQGSGILSGTMTRERLAALDDDDVRRVLPLYQEPALSKNLALVERLRELGGPIGVSAGTLAVAWTLAHPAVAGAIVGFSRPEHVDEVMGADDPTLAAALEGAGFGHSTPNLAPS